MWQELARALCLVLIIEGMLPFLYPDRWRRAVATLSTTSNHNLRFIGLVSMLVGLVLLLLID